MRYFAVATDFDGTLAHNGVVVDETVESLKALRKSGRAIIMVTGRLLEDLIRAFPALDLFDLVVAENGALLYDPAKDERTVLVQKPPEAFVARLRERRVAPLEVGHVIVSTWEPHQRTVLDTIRELGLELQVIFNKGAVMVLPSGVNKATGLSAALDRLKLSAHNTIGVGDAENDHAFMQLCECSAAVSNALEPVKAVAGIVLRGDHGQGVQELAQMVLENDLSLCKERCITIGYVDRKELPFDSYAPGTLLFAGSSGSGKSTVALGVLEQIAKQGYQVCVFDPEGDYESFEGAGVLGDATTVPTFEEVRVLLEKPGQNLFVNLLGVPVDSRPQYMAGVLPHIQTLRSRYGRPHWIAFDEAHHLFPRDENASAVLSREIFGVLAITTRPSLLATGFLDTVQNLVIVGDNPREILRDFSVEFGDGSVEAPGAGQALLWRKVEPHRIQAFTTIETGAKKQRHRRKYAMGDLAPEKSFYFTGADQKLNLRAQNLTIFLQLAEGLDDETWSFHLRRGDYAQWFRDAIGDEELAEISERVEGSNPNESRKRIVDEIEKRYTKPA